MPAATKTATPRKATRPRRAARGDTMSAKTPKTVATAAVKEALDSAVTRGNELLERFEKANQS